MKKTWLALLSLSAAAHAATVSVSSFSGTVYAPGEVALAFSDVAAAQEVWVAWDDADQGSDMSSWSENERLGTIDAGATSATFTLPPDAQAGRTARFFLFPAGQTYGVSYIRSTGTQYVNTGIIPNPTIAVSVEIMLDDMWTKQQRTFGVGTSDFTFANYINGSGWWAWSAKDGTGNWTSANQTPLHRRTIITLDVPNDVFSISVPSVTNMATYSIATTSITSVKDNQTQDGNFPLFLMAYSTSAAGSTVAGHGSMHFYGATVSLTNKVVRDFKPYVSAGVAGLQESTNSVFYGNDGSGEFIPGGRSVTDGGVASEAFSLTAARTEDVYADAYIWMRGMAIDKNGNGILDNGEQTNSLNNLTFSGTSVYGYTGHRPVISNELVTLPSRGVQRMMQTLYFPQTLVWTNDEQTCGYAFPCSLHVGKPLTDFTSHYTWLARFRPEFTTPLNSTQWLLGFGYGSQKGMMMGFSGESEEGRTIILYTAAGKWDTGIVVSNGWGWVDMAVTVDGQKVTAYVVREGAKMVTGFPSHTQKAVKTYSSSYVLTPNSDVVLRFGTESMTSNKMPIPIGSQNGNYYKTFRGSLQQFACWKRALTEDEVHAAFGWPHTDVWRVGVENDGTAEFGGTAPADGIVVDGETWPVPQTLAAGSSVTFRFPLTENVDNLISRIFRCKPTSDSGEGVLSVAVNGSSIGRRTVKAGAWQQWYVPVKTLLAGTNTLTITRSDTSSDAVKLDVAVLGGGWHVGKKDEDWIDFNYEGYAAADYNVVNGNWRDIPRVLMQTGTSNKAKPHLWCHAVMPESLADRYDWTMHFSTAQYQSGTGTRLCIDLNGSRIATIDAPGIKTTHDISIPCDMLPAGENVFEFFNDTQSGTQYISIDAIQLEPVAPPTGSMLIVR